MGRARSVKECSLKATGAMVCVCGVETIRAMGLQVDGLAKTKVLVKEMKGSRLTVLCALAVEILAGDMKSHQILYITKETKWLILSRMCLELLGMVLRSVPENGDGAMLHRPGNSAFCFLQSSCSVK